MLYILFITRDKRDTKYVIRSRLGLGEVKKPADIVPPPVVASCRCSYRAPSHLSCAANGLKTKASTIQAAVSKPVVKTSALNEPRMR